MGAQGTTTVDFGAFPGKSDASVTVTGQTAIIGSSLAEAWIFPAATADHTADEHMVESIRVFAHTVVAGTGFTISAFNDSRTNEPLEFAGVSRFRSQNTTFYGNHQNSVGGKGTRLYGTWSVAWAWN